MITEQKSSSQSSKGALLEPGNEDMSLPDSLCKIFVAVNCITVNVLHVISCQNCNKWFYKSISYQYKCQEL